MLKSRLKFAWINHPFQYIILNSDPMWYNPYIIVMEELIINPSSNYHIRIYSEYFGFCKNLSISPFWLWDLLFPVRSSSHDDKSIKIKNLRKDEWKRSSVADRWATIALHTVSEKGDRRYLPTAHVSVDTKVLTVFCIHADVEFSLNVFVNLSLIYGRRKN